MYVHVCSVYTHTFVGSVYTCACTCICTYTGIENHNSLRRERPSGLDVKQSPNVQDAFRPIPGLISWAGVTGSVGITCHARATQMVHVYLCPVFFLLQIPPSLPPLQYSEYSFLLPLTHSSLLQSPLAVQITKNSLTHALSAPRGCKAAGRSKVNCASSPSQLCTCTLLLLVRAARHTV